MRPVRLTMQAFGPYAGCEIIDFGEAVQAGLFGIYGQTGSGKSTIFSAMTFALFGEPAKEDQHAASVRSDHAEAGIPTQVEFVFDIAERRYVVLRRPEQMRLKQRGEGETRNPHEAFLFDATGLEPGDIDEERRGKILAEKKVGVVDEAIRDLLGYGKEQFRQIVLLPQGRFEKFLAAKTKERLDILRDLFDVSLYRTLAAKLKADAEAAERHVKQEREVCARRLAAEGFESTDALASGIEAAEARHAALLEEERAARIALAAAREALQQAKALEGQFIAADTAREALSGLQAGKDAVEALANRVARAERARSLRDVEEGLAQAAADVRKAEEALAQAQARAGRAEREALAADEALQLENARVGEIDDLRRQLDALERHGQTLREAAAVSQELENALSAERGAGETLASASERLNALNDALRKKSEALKQARQAETRRHDFNARLSLLVAELGAAEQFEKVSAAVEGARLEADKLAAVRAKAAGLLHETRARFEAAERNLSAAQALHLAGKLEPGAPCPVCGSSEHPSPATGAVEHAGRDQAFREAREGLQKAEALARAAGEKLAGAQGILAERQDRLAGLVVPAETAAALKHRVEAGRQAIAALGPQVDLAEAEAAIETLEGGIAAAEGERERLREEHAGLQHQTAARKAQLDAMLSPVPAQLRAADALAAAQQQAARALEMRQQAKAATENAATRAREAALEARKDLEAASGTLAAGRERHGKATELFGSRLAEAGLAQEEYGALKPAIETIEADRERIEAHRRALASAEDAARIAEEAIRDRTRPHLPEIEARTGAAEELLDQATEQRAGAGHRLDHLSKLRDDLAATMRRLEEAEAESGPLRGLAALLNGENAQKLNLETYAIGAMFDHVLAAANLRLGPMTANRYRLERELEGVGRGQRGLGIQVFDVFTGKARPTATLSGGETFIAALSLALGLADVVESASGKVRLDTIFIDEGFGSLDTENGSGTLDQVLQVLNSLVSRNRAVGLISHVPLVQEAIPNGFYVRKHLAGSTVEARGLL